MGENADDGTGDDGDDDDDDAGDAGDGTRWRVGSYEVNLRGGWIVQLSQGQQTSLQVWWGYSLKVFHFRWEKKSNQNG
jgi:hypothetical protein